METWSVDQVCSWLVEKNLAELVPRFQEEEISGAALLALNDRMVQQLVKKIGHQAVLMDLIEKYKQNSQALKPPGCPGETAPRTQAEAALEVEQSCGPASHGAQMPSFHPAENLDKGLIDQRVLKQFLWKRALKDRFKYVRRPIEDDEQVLRNKSKFGHRRGQTRKTLADTRFDEIQTVQIKSA
uniref:Sterile alpha motif domain containing 3 n=1 Tax=Chinchilla lanigera TaxID=34839 RepID=A0A8C2YPJ4_CHILA